MAMTTQEFEDKQSRLTFISQMTARQNELNNDIVGIQKRLHESLCHMRDELIMDIQKSGRLDYREHRPRAGVADSMEIAILQERLQCKKDEYNFIDSRLHEYRSGISYD